MHILTFVGVFGTSFSYKEDYLRPDGGREYDKALLKEPLIDLTVGRAATN